MASPLLVVPRARPTSSASSHGIADDFLTSLYLATKAPVVLAPAMNTNMLATTRCSGTSALLAARDVLVVVDPGEGYLACGWIGKGRLAEPADIVEAETGPQSGTQRPARPAIPRDRWSDVEDLDAVRYLGNRSSGRMGFAVAAEARRRGARVTLIAGPTEVEPPQVDTHLKVRTAAEMHDAVMREAAPRRRGRHGRGGGGLHAGGAVDWQLAKSDPRYRTLRPPATSWPTSAGCRPGPGGRPCSSASPPRH